jgi:hypothetical protein
MVPSGLRAVCLIIPFLSLVSPARAQLIPIKTIPIAQGDQFQIFPSNNLGLGGVSIALPDSLGDPFANPATTARLRGSRFFSAPTVYSVSGNAGGGRSLPFAMLTRSASWYGGLALVLQQVDPSRPPDRGNLVVEPAFSVVTPPGGGQIPGPDLRAHGNRYAFGMFGRSWEARHLSVGASALWTGLHALDGVDLLYSGSRRVEQTGHAIDVRLGMLKEWPGERGGRSLEAVVLHNRFAATHNVLYADQFWDPGLRQFVFQPRTDQNFDHTNTWGAQLEYQMPLAASGWRIGWVATMNRATHPKLPNYDITNVAVIPWDPGRSYAYNLGVGLSKVRGPATFAVEAMYEPIRSYTWADAIAPTVRLRGDTIAVGGKTIENRFTFSNAVFRIGVGRDIALQDSPKVFGLQFGLMVRSINYRLQQADNVELTRRALRTGWFEWTPTWGLTLRFPELELRYRGRITKGAGRPGGFNQFIGAGRDLAVANGTILAAPSGPLNLVDVNTSTHQISLSLPIH